MAITDRIAGLTGNVGIKAPCAAATTAAITLSGLQTIDGVALTAGDRVLVKDQADTTTNGIYVAGSSTWQRASDFNGVRDVVSGTLVFVRAGTVNANQMWKVTATDPVTVGDDAVTFDFAISFAGISISAFAQTLLDDANAAAFMTTLGISAFAQTILDDANAAASRTTLGLGGLATLSAVDTAEITDASVTVAKLDFTGTPSASTYARGDGSWGTPAVGITLGTNTATTSGTSIDFTSLPSTVTRIQMILNGVSTNGTSQLQVQIGDSGGVETTGYVCSGGAINAGTASYNQTTGLVIVHSLGGAAADIYSGIVTMVRVTSTDWVFSAVTTYVANGMVMSAGSKTLSAGPLDRVRLTTVNGTDTFDAGSVNILYE